MSAKSPIVACEVIFKNRADMRESIAELKAHGLKAEYLPGRYDECSAGTSWVLTWAKTPLDARDFMDLVRDIVEPLGGSADDAGEVDDTGLATWLAETTADQWKRAIDRADAARRQNAHGETTS